MASSVRALSHTKNSVEVGPLGARPKRKKAAHPSEDHADRPPIRSFVRREGRITRAQRRALHELWPRYGLAHPGPTLNPVESFGRDAPLTLEIGFGNGESLAQAAVAHPDQDFIGIEVHRPGVGALLLKLAANESENVRIVSADAVEVVAERIIDAGLDEIRIYFPDPWPKARHHKRRLVQPEFVANLIGKLKPGGCLHLATDWADYAGQMLSMCDAAVGLENIAGRGKFSERPDSRLKTHFEQRGVRKGHNVYDLIYRR